MPLIVITLLLASVIGGATSMAAQSALPGDMLWSFKTGVNERMQSALVPDGRVQANIDIGIIETRIQESKKISGDAERVAVVKSAMEKNIAMHADSALNQIAKLQINRDHLSAADVASRLQAALAKNTPEVLDLRSMLDTVSRLSEEASKKAEAL